jgi:type I restriction-modification system DNA methylase subunit
MPSKSQYQLNKEIEEFVLAKKTPYTQEEIAHVNRYSGYGGMWSFDADLADNPARGLYEYYTPIAVIEKMVGLAKKYGFTKGKILEPSCGIGRFLHYFDMDDNNVVAVEPDKTSYAIAKANFPKAAVWNMTFNEMFVDRRGNYKGSKFWKGQYDLVIGNPPYGSFQGRFTTQEKKTTQARTYVEYFIIRGLMTLKKGGLLIYIIPSNFLDGDNTPVKDMINSTATLIDAYRLPKSMFDQTDIQTDIVVFKKS